MFAKKVAELEYSDIEDLVNVRREREGHFLDFKVGLDANPDKAKVDLAKDISGFANAGGGYLIFGVDKKYQIVGVSKEYQGRPIDEWLNQVLVSKIEPPIFYFDPRIIELPQEPDKVLVVLHVPESTRKPHMALERFNYYVRLNDQTRPANHTQVRDMFEYTRYRIQEFESFLQKRNLHDPEDERFGENLNSRFLHPARTKKAMVLFSSIPKEPKTDKINLGFSEFLNWLRNHSSGYLPLKHINLYHFDHYSSETQVDGVVFKSSGREDESHSYFEVNYQGFVEAGYSQRMCFSWAKDGRPVDWVDAASVLGYAQTLLHFTKEFYSFANYSDEVYFQISFVNVSGYKLSGCSEKYNLWPYKSSAKCNTQHPNFKLGSTFFPHLQTEDSIKNSIKIFAEKLCRVFGLEQNYALNDEGNINWQVFKDFRP